MEENIRKIRMKETRKFSIGAVIIASFIVILVALLMVGNDKGVFGKRYELRSTMLQTGGLEGGAPVQLSGVRIGNVSEVFFITSESGSTKVEVHFKVKPEFSKIIRTDSRTFIGTLGLLGDKYLGITPGSPQKPVAKPGSYLPSDAPIDFERVIQNSIGVIDDFKVSAKNLAQISARIDSGNGTLGMLVNSNKMYTDAVGLLKTMNQIGEKIENNEGTMGKLFNDPELYNSLALALNNLSETIDTFQTSKGTLKMLMDDPDLYNHVKGTLCRVDTLLYRIQEGEGTAGALISNRELYNKLNTTVDEVNVLLEDFMENPRKYINLKVSIF